MDKSNLLSPYQHLDTPALLVDLDKVKENIRRMQAKANESGTALRPHTKTHKMPWLARLQVGAGAEGITVAKVGEAEAMAWAGLTDIFIANEIAGLPKLERLRILAEQGVRLALGVDCIFQAQQAGQVFRDPERPLRLRIEVEVGENRSGVLEQEQAVELAQYIAHSRTLAFDGIFCHEGHTYKAATLEDCRSLAQESQRRMLDFAAAIQEAGIPVPVVSVGATPSMLTSPLLPGITEIRPGTYIFMDAAQGQVVGNFGLCAATVLATVISKPTPQRVILDAGAKALTSQRRIGGICDTPGYGLIKHSGGVRLNGVFDEHGIVLDQRLHDSLSLGDKIEIIPNHICPAVNLYDRAYLVSQGRTLRILPVEGRGRIQ